MLVKQKRSIRELNRWLFKDVNEFVKLLTIWFREFESQKTYLYKRAFVSKNCVFKKSVSTNLNWDNSRDMAFLQFDFGVPQT